MLSYGPALKKYGRQLRTAMTDAENRLWTKVRRKQILEVSFYRQKPIGTYIVDFYAPKARLVIEIDGSQHLTLEHQKRDSERDRFLESQGLLVMRFDSRQVLAETDAVVQAIFGKVKEALQNPPYPPFSKGGK